MMHRSVEDDPVRTGDVVDALMDASRALVAVAARSIARVDESLSLPQFRALVVLATRGATTVGALADELGVHSSTVTRMCDRLVARRYVTRQTAASNRRSVLVTLTPAGRAVVRKVTERRRRLIGEIVANVPEQHRAAMIAALHAFSAAAGEAPDQAWSFGWGAEA